MTAPSMDVKSSVEWADEVLERTRADHPDGDVQWEGAELYDCLANLVDSLRTELGFE